MHLFIGFITLEALSFSPLLIYDLATRKGAI